MAKEVDWYYLRPKGCTACTRVSNYLASHDITVAEQVPASRKLQAVDAEQILAGVNRLVAMKGSKVEEFTVSGKPEDAAVAAMLGPTGNLRAPTVLVGKTCLVGFNQEIFDSVF